MRITYEGFYGFKNAGDDAFLEVASWGANKFWNCKENIFIGHALPSTIHPIVGKSVKFKGMDRLEMTKSLLKSDFMISAGGSTFSQIPVHSNKSIAGLISQAKKSLELGAIGVSVGPFKNIKDEKGVKHYLKQLSFIALRDKSSFDYVSSLDIKAKVVNAFDLAALLPNVYNFDAPNEIISNESKIIGVSICNYESYTNGNVKKEEKRNKYLKELVELIINKTNFNLKVFIINANSTFGDKEVSKELLAGIDEDRFNVFEYTPVVKDTWDEISNCDFMISTRLHASIFACYAKVPFSLIEYHRKCTDFLKDVGQPDSLIVGDAQKPINQTFENILSTIQNPYVAPSNIESTIERSLLNFTETIHS